MPERRVAVVLVIDSGDGPLPKWAELTDSLRWGLEGITLARTGTVAEPLGEGVVIERIEFP
jgi:hypothetical protein